MKNLLLMVLFFTFSLIVNAQVDKGRFMVGGSISPLYSKNIYPTYNLYSFGFNSNIKGGYFLFKNFVLGINESTEISGLRENDNGYSYNSSLQTHGLGLFTRYYFLNFKKIGLFGEGKLGIQLDKTKFKQKSNSYSYSHSSTNTGINYSGAIGVNYFIIHNVALELSVNYNYTNPISRSSSSNGFTTSIPKIASINAFIGFLIFFN